MVKDTVNSNRLSTDTRMCKLKPEALKRLEVEYNKNSLIDFQKDITTSRSTAYKLLQAKNAADHWVERQIVEKASKKYKLNFADEDLIFKPRESKESGAEKPAFQFDYYGYAGWLNQEYSRLSLEKLAASGGRYLAIELMNVFIPQNVRPCQDYLPKTLEMPKEVALELRQKGEWRGGELTQREIVEARREYFSHEPFVVTQLAELADRAVILGDPGSGKSSFMRSLVLEWAETVLTSDNPSCTIFTIPIFVDLRLMARAWSDGQRDILDYFCQEHKRFFVERGLLEARIRDGGVSLLFDGLDEIFDKAHREEIVRQIGGLQPATCLVTSRVIGYEGERLKNADFEHFMLQDFDDTQIDTFVNKWHGLVYSDAEVRERDDSLRRMQVAIDESYAIRELAGNPLLLTLMAIINRYQELPRDRAALYHRCSELLLQDWKVDEALRADPDLEQDAGAIGLEEKTLILRLIARQMQAGEGQLGNIVTKKTLQEAVVETLKGNRYLKGNPLSVANALIEQLRERNFILCALGGDTCGFVHRTLLEYYIALDYRIRFGDEREINEMDIKQGLYGKRWYQESWHEVLRLVSVMLNYKVVAECLEELRLVVDPAEANRPQLLAAECWAELRNTGGLDALNQNLRNDLSNIIKHHKTEPEPRQRAIRTLSRGWRPAEAIGVLKNALNVKDHEAFCTIFRAMSIAGRRDVQEVVGMMLEMLASDQPIIAEAAAWHLGIAARENEQILAKLEALDDTLPMKVPALALAHPMQPVEPQITLHKGIEFITIHEGGFWQGDVEDDAEMPPRWVYLKEYKISKDPVTVAQFRRFTKETMMKFDWNKHKPDWGWIEDHPLVNVTWDEANAFCKWAGGDLPTEAQWEKAARGTDGRKYPWSNDWDAKKCRNAVEDKDDSKGTMSVGSYPYGVSPYGVHDMAGNVWEWCLDYYGGDYYKTAPRKNSANLKVSPRRVVRGGSWYDYDPSYFRTALRSRTVPSNRYYYYGFRFAIL